VNKRTDIKDGGPRPEAGEIVWAIEEGGEWPELVRYDRGSGTPNKDTWLTMGDDIRLMDAVAYWEPEPPVDVPDYDDVSREDLLHALVLLNDAAEDAAPRMFITSECDREASDDLLAAIRFTDALLKIAGRPSHSKVLGELIAKHWACFEQGLFKQWIAETVWEVLGCDATIYPEAREYDELVIAGVVRRWIKHLVGE